VAVLVQCPSVCLVRSLGPTCRKEVGLSSSVVLVGIPPSVCCKHSHHLKRGYSKGQKHCTQPITYKLQSDEGCAVSLSHECWCASARHEQLHGGHFVNTSLAVSIDISSEATPRTRNIVRGSLPTCFRLWMGMQYLRRTNAGAWARHEQLHGGLFFRQHQRSSRVKPASASTSTMHSSPSKMFPS